MCSRMPSNDADLLVELPQTNIDQCGSLSPIQLLLNTPLERPTIVMPSGREFGVLLVRGVGAGVAVAGRYPFIPLSLEVTDHWIKYLLTSCDFAAFSALNVWATDKVIIDFAGTCTSGNCTHWEVARKTSAFLGAFFARLPLMYTTAYVYGDASFGKAFIVGASTMPFAMYSLDESLCRATLCDREIQSIELQLEKSREALIAQLDVNIDLVRDAGLDVSEYVSRILQIDANSVVPKEALLIEEYCMRSNAQIQEKNHYYYWPQISGAFLTCSEIFLLAAVTFRAAGHLFTHDDIPDINEDLQYLVQGIFAGITAGSSLWLTGTSIIERMDSITNFFSTIVCGEYQPSLTAQIAPKTNYVLKSLDLLIAALSIAPSIQISEDTFSNVGLRLYMQITVSLATVALTSMALFKVTDQLIETIASYGGFDETIDFEKVLTLLSEIQAGEFAESGDDSLQLIDLLTKMLGGEHATQEGLSTLLRSDRLAINRCLVHIFSEHIAGFDPNNWGSIGDSETGSQSPTSESIHYSSALQELQEILQTPQPSDIILILRQMESFKTLLVESPLIKYARVLSILDNEVLSTLIDEVAVLKDKLQEYLGVDVVEEGYSLDLSSY